MSLNRFYDDLRLINRCLKGLAEQGTTYDATNEYLTFSYEGHTVKIPIYKVFHWDHDEKRLKEHNDTSEQVTSEPDQRISCSICGTIKHKDELVKCHFCERHVCERCKATPVFGMQACLDCRGLGENRRSYILYDKLFNELLSRKLTHEDNRILEEEWYKNRLLHHTLIIADMKQRLEKVKQCQYPLGD